MLIKPVELTAESFKDYGHILGKSIETPLAENNELTYWGKVTELKMSDTVSTGILFGHKREQIVKSLERHVKTPEILVALEGDSVICFAKPSAEAEDKIAGIKAFYIKEGDAFVMNAGTWHWVAFPSEKEVCKFLVVFASGTEAGDLEVKDLEEEVKIDF